PYPAPCDGEFVLDKFYKFIDEFVNTLVVFTYAPPLSAVLPARQGFGHPWRTLDPVDRPGASDRAEALHRPARRAAGVGDRPAGGKIARAPGCRRDLPARGAAADTGDGV